MEIKEDYTVLSSFDEVLGLKYCCIRLNKPENGSVPFDLKASSSNSFHLSNSKPSLSGSPLSESLSPSLVSPSDHQHPFSIPQIHNPVHFLVNDQWPHPQVHRDHLHTCCLTPKVCHQCHFPSNCEQSWCHGGCW